LPYLLDLLYLLLILLALPWFVYQSVRKGKYREGFAAKLLGRVPRRRSQKPCVWLHAVSVGEVNLVAPLLKMIQQERPQWECVLSTTTMTGMAVARKKYPGLPVFYCPLDFSWAVRAAMRRIRPDVLVLAELELWPNLIRAAKKSGARVAVVNGRLSEHSFRGYRRVRPLVARLLAQVDLIAVQDEVYADRFGQLGARPETVAVTGSLKYDGAQTDRNNPATQRLRQLAGFAPNDVVFLAGSTQDPEEQAALAAFCQLRDRWPQLRLVLVPRHPDRFDAVARMLDRSGVSWQRRSGLERRPERVQGSGFRVQAPGFRVQDLGGEGAGRRPKAPHPEPRTLNPEPSSSFPGPRVLLVDAVGELGAWWGTAQIAFVGGSFGNRGGQNMIEPAAYGAAVCFGPNTRNFRDVVAAMLAHDAAAVVRGPQELAAFVRRCLEDPAYAAALGRRAQAFVLTQLGATRRTFDRLAPLVAARSLENPLDRAAAWRPPG
jgi:3-deoxy-D-manno-octulosonic-acid transferase